MLLQDLFEKIQPGERRAVELKIKDLERAIRDIERHEMKLYSMGNLPAIPGTEEDLEDLKKSYQAHIDQLKAKLKDENKPDNFDRYMKAIIKNCKTVVAACKSTDKLLYRGTKETATAFYGKPFDERYAKDSEREISAAFNQALRLEGAVATRDNSMFTTTRKGFAQGFGNNLYIIFPRDPMHFTWSDKIRDLVLNSEYWIDMVDPNVVKEIMTEIWNNPDLKREFISKYQYNSGGDDIEFDPATYPDNTRLFQKYTFSTSMKVVQQMIPNMSYEYQEFLDEGNWVDPKAVIKNFGMHIDEDLEGAFNQGYEITVRAEYYAIEAKHEKRVREYLGMGKARSSDY